MDLDVIGFLEVEIWMGLRGVGVFILGCIEDTQAGAVLRGVLKQLVEDGFENIEVSFDLSAIKSEDAPGRSDVVTADGLTAEEAKDCSFIAGQSKNVRSYLTTEFNPGIESRKTGGLLLDMFHSFTSGAQERVNSDISE